jgi:hypothetical protein
MAAGEWRMSRPHAEVDGISVILGRSGRSDRWRDTHAVVELWGAGRAGGRPKGRGGTDTPHYQVQLAAGDERYRIAVNVLSKEHPSELLYLADKLDHFMQRAAADAAARVYAFGQRWGPEPGTPDKVFGFSPGNGIHDLHMNQGNSSSGVTTGSGRTAACWLTIRRRTSESRSSWPSSRRHGTPMSRPGMRSPAPDLRDRRDRRPPTRPSASWPRWSTPSARHPRSRR